jgi:uncharacterized protein (DUF697 family)
MTDADREVQEYLRRCALLAAGAALQPLPFMDMAFLMPIHIAMVQGVARIRGYETDLKTALEIYRTVRLSILSQTAILAGLKFVPLYGALASPPLSYALTLALGEVADYYFVHGRKTPASELHRMFKERYRKHRKRAKEEVEAKKHEIEKLRPEVT